MRRILMKTIVFMLVGLFALPVWAGGPVESAREWIAFAAEQDGKDPEAAVPEAGYLYYVDLMSNAGDSFGGWVSFLCVTNWSFSVRLELFTAFIPTEGTPNDIKNRNHFINPNAVVYLNANQLGFNTFGPSNWYGIVYTATNNFYTAGVLLYHSEYGLTWIAADGPYQL